jgi:HNH endonuclease
MSALSTASVRYLPIPDFPGYRVGDDGSVWSSWKLVYGGILGASSEITDEWHQLSTYCGNYHPSVVLVRNRQPHTKTVHVIVLETFTQPRRSGLVCRHKNGIGTDCRLENLEWGTPAENEADKIRHGTDGKGERIHCHVLVASQIPGIRLRLAAGESNSSIARDLGLHHSTISQIRRGVTWRHIP